MGKLGKLSLEGQVNPKLAKVSTAKKQDISPLHVEGLKAKTTNVLKNNSMQYPGQAKLKNTAKLNDPILRTKAPSQIPGSSSAFKNTSKLPSFLK